jgi:ATP-dependent DNA helicase RecG
MNIEEIKKLAEAGADETQSVEFKKSTAQLTEAFQSLCGFLNTDGGTVIIGVGSDGTIHGQEIGDSTKQQIASKRKNLEPSDPVQIQYVPLPDSERSLIVLSAEPDQSDVPYSYDGRPYERVENTTRVMERNKYDRQILKGMREKERWENGPAEGYTIDDLDKEEILKTVRVGIESGRLPETTGRDPETILQKLDLMKNGELRNSAMVLFGNDLQSDYPQCLLRLARFPGTEKDEFLDNRQIRGHAFKILHEALEFVRLHTPISGKVNLPEDTADVTVDDLARDDRPAYPVKALREAVINAICHRDYSHEGGSISVGIYSNRLEISSMGTLPGGISLDELKEPHESVLRNPDIANVFYRRGMIEQWGTGFEQIMNTCEKAGNPEPEFIERSGFFTVRFFPSDIESEQKSLSDRQKEILEIALAQDRITISECAENFDVSERTIRRDLKDLLELNLIEKKGSGPSTHYVKREK